MYLEMRVHSADMRIVESDALALEYQRDYGTAWRHLNLSDLIDDPTGQSPIRIFGLSLKEQSFNCRFVEACTVFDDGANAILVSLNGTKPLP